MNHFYRQTRRWFLIIVLPMTIGFAFPLAAARIPWQLSPYDHYSKDENLADLLRDFCSSQRLSCVFSEKVAGTVNGRFNQRPEIFFNFITTAYSLTWYYDGSVLFIYRSDEIESQMITLEYLAVAEFKRSLSEIEIADGRFPLRAVDQAGIVYVAGPKRFVDLVTQTAAVLDQRAAATSRVAAAQDVIRVFSLRHAWADDQTFFLMNREVVFPGVATALRNILAGKPTPGLTAGKRVTQHPLTVRKLKGSGLIAVGRDQQKDVEGQLQQERQNDGGAERISEAFIHADTRLNAVIVRDSQERMPFYEEVIPLLDVPAGLVQIQASIMDVSTDFLRELGVNWRLALGDQDDDLKVRGGFNADRNFDVGSSQLVLPDGLSFTTIIGNTAEFFMARINALEETGEARILARPSVLTLNNLEAQLEQTRTFYARVSGDKEVDLFPVTAGIVLKVTPHIIEEEGAKKIKLAVKVEDGSVLDTTVDGLPETQNNVINTQAVIKENESLLIGGSIHEEKIEVVQKVPFLGDIPVIKYLFMNKVTKNSKMERLFLITPRIIEHENYPTVPEFDMGQSYFPEAYGHSKSVEIQPKTGNATEEEQ